MAGALSSSRFGRLPFALALACCATPQAKQVRCSEQPASGLYEVRERACENPLNETDFCPLTQYLEVADGAVFGVPADPRVLVFWYAEERASTEYAYVVWPLHGRCSDEARYVVDRGLQASAWLTLRNGTIREYAYERFTSDDRSKLMFRAHFWLAAVARTAELDQRLHVERE